MNQDVTFCANSEECPKGKTCKWRKENNTRKIAWWQKFYNKDKKCEFYKKS